MGRVVNEDFAGMGVGAAANEDFADIGVVNDGLALSGPMRVTLTVLRGRSIGCDGTVCVGRARGLKTMGARDTSTV